MVAAAPRRPIVVPTEVSSKAKRRVYSAEYKLKVLAELDSCTQPGEVGAVLRREGLYSSHIVEWRRSRDRGELDSPKRRGPKARVPDERDRAIAALEREVSRQKARAERAEALVALQKKVADLLSLSTDEPSGKS